MDSEDWAAYRESMARQSKETKADRLNQNIAELDDKGLCYTLHNNGLHAIITAPNGRMYDLWPSTGRWHDRSTGRRSGGGTARLFEHMGIA